MDTDDRLLLAAASSYWVHVTNFPLLSAVAVLDSSMDSCKVPLFSALPRCFLQSPMDLLQSEQQVRSAKDLTLEEQPSASEGGSRYPCPASRPSYRPF